MVTHSASIWPRVTSFPLLSLLSHSPYLRPQALESLPNRPLFCPAAGCQQLLLANQRSLRGKVYTTNAGVFGQPDHGIKNLVFECIATGQTPAFLQQTPVTVSYQLKKKNLFLNFLPPSSPLAVGEMPDLMPVKKWDSSLWLISVCWLCLNFSVGISLTAKKSEWASAPLCLSSVLFINENHC